MLSLNSNAVVVDFNACLADKTISPITFKPSLCKSAATTPNVRIEFKRFASKTGTTGVAPKLSI